MSAPGRFVWFDVMTHDQDKTVSFYTQLFGWSVAEFPMGDSGQVYPMLTNGGPEDAEGGVDEIPEDQRAEVPSHWINYITVADVDAACARVTELGGQVLQAPYDIPTVGRTAVCADPQGARFSPFKSNDPPAEAEPKVGEPCWVELMTSDKDAAAEFYQGVFGYGQGAGPVEGYVTLKRGERPAAGVMANPGYEGKPAWLTYIWVDDLDAATAKVPELGGSLIAGPMAIPGIGRVSCCLDDLGAMFGIFGDPVTPE